MEQNAKLVKTSKGKWRNYGKLQEKGESMENLWEIGKLWKKLQEMEKKTWEPGKII